MTQWRVSPDGERQYLGDDGYWYVAASQQDAPSSPPPQMAEPTPRKRKSSKRVLLAIVIVVAMLGAGGAIFVATRSSTSPARYFTIPSGAMEPTLQIGDTVKVENGAVDRGSIVIFSRPPAENCGGPEVNDLVKRVIGLPGDVISLSAGNVHINGKRIDESWLPASEQGITVAGPAGKNWNLSRPYRVPLDNYFVMGDNRTDSCDSRYWGPVAKSLIVGEVVAKSGP